MTRFKTTAKYVSNRALFKVKNPRLHYTSIKIRITIMGYFKGKSIVGRLEKKNSHLGGKDFEVSFFAL